ncbi:hypothetical protein PC9H_003763 [Pleurotus ostreatus]|uniref:RecA family profile 1 domain-containing protein n=1 Tax=Pleurotus ostreatus TaxID=5322 RepID=A0A8H7A1G7_PLEOS|nr:uncharacterized protein PC9H_003763 [Pleurotus ostreatus]KAF7436929.1 hypothetical protein PC9H_003763 [Pleurotus ostreatus]KAJ8702740.1 hypothetical protein PTI98_001432 [Pleurotus ostreatus]
MSKAAQTLLEEIHSESLQVLLASLRPHSGLSEVAHADTISTSSSAVDTSPSSTFRLGNVVEIQGPSASGKSHLVYHLVSHCIIPPEYEDCALGGWGKAAMVFDSDNTFSIARVKQILLKRLESRFATQPHLWTAEWRSDIVEKCLDHLHIFKPSSSIQLAATLRNLPAYHTDNLPHTDIGVLAVDSINAFYWMDRFIVEHPSSSGKASKATVNPFQHVISSLRALHAAYRPLILLTSWLIGPNQSSSNCTSDRQHPSIYADPRHQLRSTTPMPSGTITHRVTMSVIPAPQPLTSADPKWPSPQFVCSIQKPGHDSVGRFMLQINDGVDCRLPEGQKFLVSVC